MSNAEWIACYKQLTATTATGRKVRRAMWRACAQAPDASSRAWSCLGAQDGAKAAATLLDGDHVRALDAAAQRGAVIDGAWLPRS